MTAILRLQLDDKDPVRVNSAINQLAESYDRNARSRLTASTTLYVSTTGSDTNSGTSAGSPFLTIQHAYDVIVRTIDTAGFTATIQCAAGTYTTALNILQPWTGGGNVTLDLGGGSISSAATCIVVICTLPNPFVVQNGTLTSSGGSCINNSGTGIVSVGTGMTFGSAVNPGGSHISAGGIGSKVTCTNPYTITGGAQIHYTGVLAGNTVQGGNITVTIIGTPVISFFAFSTRGACLEIISVTFAGGTTGIRYSVDSNAIINTGGGGANYFPGTSPGIPPSTGGQYL